MDEHKAVPVRRAGAPPMSNKGYGDAGASYVKKSLKGFTARSGSPREDIDAHNYTLRQRARMLYMSAPMATSAIKTNRTNVIGSGLWLNSRINRATLGLTEEQAREWQHKTEEEFELWAADKRNCDALGVSNFYSAQGLAFSAQLLSGDVFVVIRHEPVTDKNPYGLRFQLVEADRISTPAGLLGSNLSTFYTQGTAANGNSIYDGVEVDKNSSAIVAYYIRNTYPFEATAVPTNWVRVEAYGKETGLPNILHIMEPERPEQYRGVTYLAQVIEPLLQARRYTDSELTAAVVESFFTAFITTELDPNDMPYNEVGGEGVPPVSDDENEYEMGPGTVNLLKPGENVAFAEPKRPTGGFDAFMNAVFKQVGAALEIPADLLLKAFNASYSASRAALLEAWKAFKMRREWFIDDFCKPIYEVWLCEAVARGRIQAPGFFSDPRVKAAWLGSEWTGPSQGQLDPVKEIQAEQLACENGFSTREQATVRLNGGSYEVNAEQLKKENELLKGASGRKATPSAQQPQPSAIDDEAEADGKSGEEENDELDRLAAALLPRLLNKLKQTGSGL